MIRITTVLAAASIALCAGTDAYATSKNSPAKAPPVVTKVVSGVKKAGEAIKNEAAAIGRGVTSAPKYGQQAFASEKTDKLAHEKAAAQWGQEVGNARVAGTLRAVGEVGQAVYYTGKDIKSRVTTGQPGLYQPYTAAYVRDAIQDVRNSVSGAKGTSPYLKK